MKQAPSPTGRVLAQALLIIILAVSGATFAINRYDPRFPSIAFTLPHKGP
jgi:hypothetical protein